MKTNVKAIIASLGSVLFTGCLTPAANTAGDAGPQLSRCEQMATIDDFEDADNQISLREGRGGYIYTYKDGLGTEIEFPAGDFRAYPGGVGGSKYMARFRGQTADAAGDIYAGLGFNFTQAGPQSPYDATKYTGVTFLAKRGNPDAIEMVRFNLEDTNTHDSGGICTECFNHFGQSVRLSDQWTRYVVFFDELEQRAGWGDPRPATVEPSALIGVSFQISLPNVHFDLMVDDIRFIGACDEPFLPSQEDDAQEAVAPAPDPEPVAKETSTEETSADTVSDASASEGETSEDGASEDDDTADQKADSADSNDANDDDDDTTETADVAGA